MYRDRRFSPSGCSLPIPPTTPPTIAPTGVDDGGGGVAVVVAGMGLAVAIVEVVGVVDVDCAVLSG